MALEQIIPGRLVAWYAATSESEPAITGDVSGWTSLANNYIEPGGIVLEYQDDLEPVDLLKDLAPATMRRVREQVSVQFTIMDMHIDTFARFLNGNTVTDTAAVSGTSVGYQSVNITRGNNVSEFSLLFRGRSAYAATNPTNTGWISQIWLPKVYCSSIAPITYTRSSLSYQVTCMSLQDDTNGLGAIRMVDELS